MLNLSLHARALTSDSHRPMALESLTPVPVPLVEGAPSDNTSASAAHALAELSAGEGAAVQALVQASSTASEQEGQPMFHAPQEPYIQHVQVTYAPQAYAPRQPVLFPPPTAVYTMPISTAPHHQIQYVVPPTNALQAHHFYPAHNLEILPHDGSLQAGVLGKRPMAFYSSDMYGAPTASTVVMAGRPPCMSSVVASAPGSGKKGPKAGTKRARYDDDFKEQVVREAMRCPEGARIKPTCSRYPGVEPCQLRKWIQKFAQQQQQEEQLPTPLQQHDEAPVA